MTGGGILSPSAPPVSALLSRSAMITTAWKTKVTIARLWLRKRTPGTARMMPAIAPSTVANSERRQERRIEPDHGNGRGIGADRHHGAGRERDAACVADQHRERAADDGGGERDREHVLPIGVDRQARDGHDDQAEARGSHPQDRAASFVRHRGSSLPGTILAAATAGSTNRSRKLTAFFIALDT